MVSVITQELPIHSCWTLDVLLKQQELRAHDTSTISDNGREDFIVHPQHLQILSCLSHADVLWWMPIELPSPGVWAQVPSKDAESCAVLMESVLECLVRNMHMSRSLDILAALLHRTGYYLYGSPRVTAYILLCSPYCCTCMTNWRRWTICATWPLGCRHHLMPAVIRALTKQHNWRNGEIDSHLLVLSNWKNGFPRYCD